MSHDSFRFDRTVGLSLLVTLMLQTGAALTWAGSANARLAELETEVDLALSVNERLARLEGETAIMRMSLRRIEEALHDED